MRYKTAVIIAVLMLLGLAVALSVQKQNPSPVETSQIADEKRELKIEIEQRDYNNGVLTITGKVKNTGSVTIASPKVIATVTRIKDRTVLAESRTIPAGFADKPMKPMESGAFQFYVSVPGKPDLNEIDFSATTEK